ncbi:iron-containing alcohol dehydrogenase, partial [bacterium]|nr:iron-containing alcohol dehydrogenase [bacterium]
SGTGSEVNQYAVITDTQRDVKFIIMSDNLIPNLAIIDPELCKSMPPGLTAESGIDALGHCIEGYVGVASPYHPYYEALALYGVKLIGRSLKRAYRNGDDTEARTDMCMAAIYGGIAFTKGLGIGHAIAHVLGAQYHISHGKAVAIGLPCFVKANKAACREQFSDLAWALDRSEDLEIALGKLYKDLKVPSQLRNFEIPEEDLKSIASDTTRDVVNLASNPASLSENQILKVLKEYY